MAGVTVNQPLQSTLQKQAIDDALAAFSTLPQEDLIFKTCVAGKERLLDVVQSLLQHKNSHKNKRSTVILERFQHYTLWIQGMGDVIDVAVQTQAGIACPVWAPIKFALKVSKDVSKTTELIIDMIESISECLPRLEIYEKLSHSDQMLQACLLRVFTDIISFSVKAFQFYRQPSLVRLVRSCTRNFDEELKSIIARLERHARVADQTALAKELFEAAEFRAEHRQKDERESLYQCERRLRPANIDEIHQNRISMRLGKTCRWILDHEKYRLWREQTSPAGPDRVLQIMGTPGCGKSILASFIVSSLVLAQKITLYCPFISTFPQCRTADNFVQNALWQLLKSNLDSQLKQDLCQHISHANPSITELWQIFARHIESTTEVVYLVLDGLDECADFELALLPRLMSLMLECGNLRLLCLGRPYALEALALPPDWTTQRIEITVDLVGKDVLAYTQNEVAKLNIIEELELRAKVVHALVDKADTMFLWVQLMISDLRKSVSISDMKQKLTSLPQGLEEAFQIVLLHILEGSNSSEIRLAQTVLTILSIVSRPLTFNELDHAQAVDLWSVRQQRKYSIKEHLLIQPAHRIAEICGGLLVVREGLVDLVHASVRDFLRRPLEKWVTKSDMNLKYFRVDEIAAHRFLAKLCMNTIDVVSEHIPEPTSLLEDTTSLRAIKQEYPFALYAYCYAFHHLNRGVGRTELDVRVTQLLASKHANLWFEIFIELLAENPSLDVEIGEFEKWVSTTGIDIESTLMFDTSYWLRTFSVLQLPDSPEQNDTCFEEDNCSERVRAEDSRIAPGPTSLHDVCNRIDAHSRYTPVPQVRDWSASAPTRESHRIPSSVRAVSHATNLLRTTNFSSTSGQIQMFAMLARALRYTRKIVDPLEAFFNLILSRAASLSVYVLMGVVELYISLGKFEQARKLATAALLKVENQETLTKYLVYVCLSQCYGFLGQDDLAYESAKIAEKGFRDILGQAHWGTCAAGQIKGNYAYTSGKYEEAVECLRQLQKLGNIRPFNIEVSEWWAWTACTLGRSLRKLNQIEQAESEFQRVYSNLKLSVSLRMEALFELGICNYERRQYEKAKSSFQQFLLDESYQRKETDWRPPSATLYVAHCNVELGHFEEARGWYLRSRELYLKREKEESSKSLNALIQMGNCEFWLKNYEEAKMVFQKAYELHLKKVGHEDNFSRSIIQAIGHCEFGLLKYEEAKIQYQKLCSYYSIAHEEQSMDCANMRKFIANCEYELGRYEQAKQMFQEICPHFCAKFGDTHHDSIGIKELIGKCEYQLGRWEQARSIFEEVNLYNRQQNQDGNYDAIQVQERMGWCEYELRNYEKARIIRSNIYSKYCDIKGEASEECIRVRVGIGYCEYKMRKFEEAKVILQEVYPKWCSLYGETHSESVEMKRRIGVCERELQMRNRKSSKFDHVTVEKA